MGMKTNAKNVLPFQQSGAFYHKRACLQVDRSNYLDAIGFFRKALECEPNNADYLLDLADAYARMNCFDESNHILITIVRRGLASPECFFGLGYNFLALKQYASARDALLTYQRLEPDGEFADAAEDMLDEMEEMEDFSFPPHIMEQAARGKRALDEGDFPLAVELFDDLLRQDGSLTFVRNNLALTYFCMQQNAKAIRETKAVLAEDPENLHALCNIALFFAESGKREEGMEYLQPVLDAQFSDPDDLYKLCLTLLELKQDREAAGRLRELLMVRPYDKRALHYYAVSCYNLGRYREALSAWGRVGRIDPDSPVAPYCMQRARDAMVGEPPERMHYNYQLPGEEVRNRLGTFFQMLTGSREDVRERFEQEPSFRALARWGMGVHDESFQLATIKLLGFVGGQHAEEMLRDFLMDTEEDDALKKEAMANLKAMGAKEPYMALMNGSIVEVRVNVFQENVEMNSAQQAVADIALRRMPDAVFHSGLSYEEVTDGLLALWLTYLRRQGDRKQRVVNPINWAAALAACFMEQHGIAYTRADILARFEVTANTLSKYIRKLHSVLPEPDGEDT